MVSKKPKGRGMVAIDLSPLAVAIGGAAPHHADLKRVLQGMASAARGEWVRLAQTELRTTARDYIQGIQEPEEKGDAKIAIALVGVLPNMIENGWDGGDLRKTLLGPSSRAKTAADGSRYNTIPFRHGAPGSSGRNTGRPMPTAIHQVVKHLAPTISRPGHLKGKKGLTSTYGERLHPGMKMSKQAQKIMSRKERPHHKSSIYEGMIRKQKTYEGATQNQYTTFRRISSKVRVGWIHPGITARKLGDKVGRYVAKIQADLIRQATKA